MKASKDYIAMWFDVRKELGINDDMSIGQMEKSSGEINWNNFAHCKMDGIGGVASILREHGYPCINLPKSGEKQVPSMWQLYKLNRKFKKDKRGFIECLK